MGCWNHTCAVTNLPIHHTEEVVVILLRTNSFQDDSSYCYSDSNWTPIPLTFNGTYNDYGSVENCNGHALDIIIDTMRENLHELEVGENEYHDVAAKKEDFDIEYMFRLDHKGRFLIKNPLRAFPDSAETCRVKHIVVRKDVYDGIVTKTKYGRWWDSKSNITFGKIDVNEFTNDLDALLDPDDLGDSSALDALDSLSDLDEKELIAIRKSFKRYRMYEGVGGSPVNELINGGLVGINRPLHILETLVALREEKSDLYDGVLDNALRFAFFNLFMEQARKTYTVPSGMGSQDDTTAPQELCARLTLSSAKAQRKWMKERYEE